MMMYRRDLICLTISAILLLTGTVIAQEDEERLYPEHCYGKDDDVADVQSGRGRRFAKPTVESDHQISIGDRYGNRKPSYRTTTIAPETTTFNISRLSWEFMNCSDAWSRLEPGCFDILPNGSMYLRHYGRMLNESDFFMPEDGSLHFCNRIFTTETDPKFDEALAISTNVGMVISMICIVLHIIMFVVIPSLRNLPGYCLVSLCVSLLVTYTTMFLVGPARTHQNCEIYMLSLMYFWLTAFFWMNVLSYDVWRSLRLATMKLRLATDMWRRLAAYSCYAWGGPILVIITVTVIVTFGDVSAQYSLTPNPDNCWFMHRPALLWYFVVPMTVLLMTNLLFFIWSFVMISSSAMKDAENKSVLSIRFFIFLKLFVVNGLAWILGCIATATEVNAFWYMYSIVNSSQGVLIFVSFSFGKKTKQAWKSYVNKRKVSSCPTQASFQSQQFTEISETGRN